ncbi:hypothetical protein EYF80_037515 [Liparis tanakae]|uniref:Uncharacterized protein n=1 Tax=Liparis tanakae TaxID=230148 RepID=A0A4Z2GFH8_9TELE|nr:hypothetical protein EYF80_037515 [Liparis tanakae]
MLTGDNREGQSDKIRTSEMNFWSIEAWGEDVSVAGASRRREMGRFQSRFLKTVLTPKRRTTAALQYINKALEDLRRRRTYRDLIPTATSKQKPMLGMYRTLSAITNPT